MAARSTSDISTRGCLAMAGIVLAILGLMVGGVFMLAQRERVESAKQRAAKLAEEFENVKGSDSVRVFLDPTLIEMLAGDSESVQNLTELDLSMVDFRGHNMAAAKKLSNVKRMTAYSCHDMENLLSAMQGSPAVEELYFDSTAISDDGVQLLSTFPNLKKVYFGYVGDQDRIDLLKSTIPNVTLEIAETE